MNEAIETCDDATLLRRYAGGAGPAFRELVRRHLGMVQGTARRILTAAPHWADDVTQTVFTDLAKKAATLPAGVVLGGWLHRHTCYLALNTARTEHRRRQRERTAMDLQTLHAAPAHDEAWQKLAPVLDEAMNGLAAADRDAIVLRYLQQCSVREVAGALQATEDAAQKRLARALEKLRVVLTSRGVTLSGALLTATLEAGAAAAPTSAGLAATISATALSNATVAASALAPFRAMLTSKFAGGAAAMIAVACLMLVLISQNTAVAPATPSAPAIESGPATPTPARAPAPALGGANVEPSNAPSPGVSAALPDTRPNSAGPVSPADGAIAPGPDAIFQSASPAAPAAPAAASEVPGGGMSDDPNRPVRSLTVRDGQLSMTTTYADGSVSTVPYKEAGATVTITPGPNPDTHVLTFRDEDDGKILSRITGVPEAPPDKPATSAPVDGAKSADEPGAANAGQ